MILISFSHKAQYSAHPFFIEKFVGENMNFPFDLDLLFRWIRVSDTTFDKKFILYYLIKKEFASLVNDQGRSFDQQGMEEDDANVTEGLINTLNENFFKTFHMVKYDHVRRLII